MCYLPAVGINHRASAKSGFPSPPSGPLVVSQNVTTRDDADHQQPFNLHVPGGVITSSGSGTMYDVSFLRI